MSARIVATAENFAFGPAGKVVTVGERLASQGHRLTFLGYGTALELARRSDAWERVVECDTDRSGFEDLAAPVLDGADLLVSAVDRGSVQLARRRGVPVVWLDPLSWWWGDEAPSWLGQVELCIAQRSIRAGEDGPYRRLPANHVVVGPIVGCSAARRRPMRTRGLLVNLGGGEASGWYELGRETDYPRMLMTALVGHADVSAFDSVTVVGGEHAVHECRHAAPNAGFAFESLSHADFVERLADAAALLTVPGLEAPLEAWTLGVPVVFAPPSNSSQYVQLGEYRRQGVGGASVHLRDFLPPLDLDALSLRERSAAFFEQLRRFEHDPAAVAGVGCRLDAMLRAEGRWPDLVRRGHAYIERLGGDGLDACVDAINGLLARG